MKLLALDPSSTCTGWAVCNDGDIVIAGRISPPHQRYKRKLTAEDRIDCTCQKLAELMTKCEPNYCVIETPSGKTHGRIKKAAGLATYGMAVGAAREVARQHCQVISADANEWKRGKGKDHFKIIARGLWCGYRPDGDSGGDIADAICLANWAWKRLPAFKREGVITCA